MVHLSQSWDETSIQILVKYTYRSEKYETSVLTLVKYINTCNVLSEIIQRRFKNNIKSEWKVGTSSNLKNHDKKIDKGFKTHTCRKVFFALNLKL